MDFKEVVEAFFVESFEGLDMMESGLLSMEPGHTDPELIHAIFRAAHSIKGGGGTFGFGEVSDFMHAVEALLEELRQGKRETTSALLELLLESVDCAREMLRESQYNHPLPHNRISKLLTQLQGQLLKKTNNNNNNTITNNNGTQQHWHIRFKPLPDLLRSGNDPIKIFRELQQLGRLESRSYSNSVPKLSALESKKIYLRWHLDLHTDANEAQIKEVFEWVDDECDLEINLQEKKSSKPSNSGDPQTAESVRVSIEKIDNLINLVGELVITQSMLSRFENNVGEHNIYHLQAALRRLMLNTRELQENVLQIRMLPIRFSFNRMPRLVHDTCKKLNKKVDLQIIGEETELDKTVLEKINDPLVHLVRNSLDHGMELPEERLALGKPERGTIELKAFHEGGNVVIEVHDNGRGLNFEKIMEKAKHKNLITHDDNMTQEQIGNLIFHPGFSTVDEVSDLSGRGVGMDVVKRNINELGGDVWVQSKPGQGTTITIKLPLTLAILDGQLVKIKNETYIIPLISIIETLQIQPERINELPGKYPLYRLRNTPIPIINLQTVFSSLPDKSGISKDDLLVIVDSERQNFGILVDELLDQQQVVVKSLETNFKSIQGISGATILGDGTVALILDIQGIIHAFSDQNYKTAVA